MLTLLINPVIKDTILEILFVLADFAVSFVVPSIVFQIVFSVAGMKILEKTGEEGWKFLIPVYGGLLFFKKTCDSGVLFWALLGMISLGIMSYQLSVIFSLLFGVMFLFFWIVFNINLGTAFDKTIGFGVGLGLLSIVFYYLMAFDDSRYVMNEYKTMDGTVVKNT